MDNAPSPTGLDANILLVIHVMFVARLFLPAMTNSLPVGRPLRRSSSARDRRRGVDGVHITNEIGPSGLAIIGGACFVGAVTQTFSSAILMIELTDTVQFLIPTLISICLSRLVTVGVHDHIMIVEDLPCIQHVQNSSHQTAEMVVDVVPVPVPEFTNSWSSARSPSSSGCSTRRRSPSSTAMKIQFIFQRSDSALRRVVDGDDIIVEKGSFRNWTNLSTRREFES